MSEKCIIFIISYTIFQNQAGSRTAPPAMLKVLAPPTVLRGPQDTEVIEGDGLDLPCEVCLRFIFHMSHFKFIPIGNEINGF